jgi:hypothetical protein
MTKTLTYVTLLHHVTPEQADIHLKSLILAGIDCYIDEKKNLVCHPDQWEAATTELMLTF